MNVKFRRFFDYISSRRFAIILLVVITIIMVITNLLPNTLFMSDGEAERFIRESPFLYRVSNAFHVMNLTGSPFFLVIPCFVVLSVTICTYKRVERKMSTSEGSFSPPPPLHIFSPEKEMDIAAFLVGRGWRLNERREGGIHIFSGSKGNGGIWGSVLFHVGLNTVIVGAVVSMFTLFNSQLKLTEGFETSLHDQLSNILKPAELIKFPYPKMFLQSFDASYVEGGFFPLDYEAAVRTTDRDGRTGFELIKVNQSLLKGGYQFLLHKYYFAPRFVITEKESGKVIDDAYINLLISNVDMKDEFDVKDTGIRVVASFFPDYYRDGDSATTRSMNLANPVFMLEFFKGPKKLGDGALPQGKKMDFDGGKYTIEFRDLRHWIILAVSRDSGLPFVKWGLGMIVLGLVIRMVLNEKRLWIKESLPNGVRVLELSARAAYFPALFEEEINGISKELRMRTEDV